MEQDETGSACDHLVNRFKITRFLGRFGERTFVLFVRMMLGSTELTTSTERNLAFSNIRGDTVIAGLSPFLDCSHTLMTKTVMQTQELALRVH